MAEDQTTLVAAVTAGRGPTVRELLADADQGKHFCCDCAFIGKQEPIGGEIADDVSCWGSFVLVCVKRHLFTDPVTKKRTFARCRTIRTGDTCPDFQAKPEPKPALGPALEVIEPPKKGWFARLLDRI
jgi:hypothetical protein